MAGNGVSEVNEVPALVHGSECVVLDAQPRWWVHSGSATVVGVYIDSWYLGLCIGCQSPDLFLASRSLALIGLLVAAASLVIVGGEKCNGGVVNVRRCACEGDEGRSRVVTSKVLYGPLTRTICGFQWLVMVAIIGMWLVARAQRSVVRNRWPDICAW